MLFLSGTVPRLGMMAERGLYVAYSPPFSSASVCWSFFPLFWREEMVEDSRLLLVNMPFSFFLAAPLLLALLFVGVVAFACL